MPSFPDIAGQTCFKALLVLAASAFRAEDSLANLFGGKSAYVDSPYRIGDYIFL